MNGKENSKKKIQKTKIISEDLFSIKKIIERLSYIRKIEKNKLIQIILEILKESILKEEEFHSTEIFFDQEIENFLVKSNDKAETETIREFIERKDRINNFRNLNISKDITNRLKNMIKLENRKKRTENFLLETQKLVWGFVKEIDKVNGFYRISLEGSIKAISYDKNLEIGKKRDFIIERIDDGNNNIIVSSEENRKKQIIKEIFFIEVPELKQGKIEIVDILYTDSLIKVILKSNDNKINPIVCCIGFENEEKEFSRINSIRNKLGTNRNTRKIELISWAPTVEDMLTNMFPLIGKFSFEIRNKRIDLSVSENKCSLILSNPEMIGKIEWFLNKNYKLYPEKKIHIISSSISWEDVVIIN